MKRSHKLTNIIFRTEMWSKLYRKIINYPLAAERCDRMKSRNIASSETGRIHDARGWGVVPDHLAKLLHHHRLRCGDADGIDIRGDDLDCGGAGARVVAEWGDCSIQHAQRRAFLPRAAGRRDSQRTLAGTLECWSAAGPLGSRGDDLRGHRAPAGTPSDGLSTGAGRLAVSYGLSAGLLHRPPRRGDCAPRPSGTGTVRHRRGNGAAPVHRHPQRLG